VEILGRLNALLGEKAWPNGVRSSSKPLKLLIADVRYSHTAYSNERFYDLRPAG
jgi:hypothetical protein